MSKKGKPPVGNCRLITKKEHFYLKKFGIKRTFFIETLHNNELLFFKHDKEKKRTHLHFGESMNINDLIRFWSIK